MSTVMTDQYTVMESSEYSIVWMLQIERLERQKLDLSLELRMTAEAMERLRSEKADEDHKRRRTQIQFKVSLGHRGHFFHWGHVFSVL